MSMSDAELKILLSAKDNASQTLKSMRGELEKVAVTAKDVAVGFVAASVGMSLISTGGVMVGRAFQGIVSSIFDMNATLETSTLQFKTLTGSADIAQAHVAMLFQIAKETPFETGPIIAASQALEAFGGGALNTRQNILMVGDAAAATGSPIQELGFWVGRLYSSLAAGKPFGEAAQRLQELKVLSPEARMAMEKLQETGGSTAAAWDILTTSFSKFEGGMKEQATTWKGLVSTFTDGANMLIGAAFKPVFEAAKTALGGINDFIDENGEEWAADMAKSVEHVIEALGGVPDSADPVGEFLKALPGWIDGTAAPMKQLIADVGDLAARAKTLAGLADGVGKFFATLPGGAGLPPQDQPGRIGPGPARPAPGPILPPIALTADEEHAAWLAQQAAEAELGARLSEAEGRRLSNQAKNTDAATALENERNAKNALTKNFASDEAAARKALADAKAAAAEFERTKPITLSLFGEAFAHGAGADLDAGRTAFDSMRKVIEDGGQSNIDAVGKMAADMAQKMRTSGMDPADADAWVGSFMDAINVAVVTKSVDAARNVGELVKAFDIERQMQDAGRKAADAINTSIDQTTQTITDAQTKTAESVKHLQEEFDFSASVKLDMDRLNEAVRIGMKAMQDTISESARDVASKREMFDLGTSVSRDTAAITRTRGREDLSATISIQRQREDMTEAHNRRLRDINQQGGPGAAAAIAAENRSFSEQTQQQAKQESRATADRQRARADQNADRALALQLAGEDRALRDARAASDREQQTINENMLTIEHARLELPIKQLSAAGELRGLNQQIAAAYQAQDAAIDKANEALAERIRLSERELILLRERLGIMGAAGDSTSSGGDSGGLFGRVASFIQNNTIQAGIIGTEQVIENIVDELAAEGMREVRSNG